MDTLIINAHPDPYSSASATNRMVAHLLSKLPVGSAQTVNLAETDIQPLDKAVLEMFVATDVGSKSSQLRPPTRHCLSDVQLRHSRPFERLVR